MGEIHASAARPQGVVVPLYQLSADNSVKSPAYAHCRYAPPARQKRAVGPMTLFFDESRPDPAIDCLRLNELAQDAELLIDSYQTYLRAERYLGVDISSIVVGTSEALRSLQAAIAKVAQSRLPVLIEAEFGSDVIAVAAAAHCQNARMHCPFVTLSCACQQPHEFQRNLCAAMKEAMGGSLFLSEVDMLNEAMQRDLLGAISSGLGYSSTKEDNVRLLSASTCPIGRMVSEGRFCRFLRAQLELLRIEVPPLRDRKEDVGPLAEYEIGVRLESRKSLSQEARHAFERYHWPGNIGELRQAVSRLAVMSDSDCIALEDLAAHTSLLNGEIPCSRSTAAASSEPQESAITTESDAGNAQAVEAITGLAHALAVGNHIDLTQYGLGVQRALIYMSKRYQTDISLTELAENAYLSASHLSFLFKKMLGVPFKALLAVVRIEKAKQLLAENPAMSVTEVSLDSGFGDLSHFERTFKRIVGVNPREYRRRQSVSLLGGGCRLEAKGPLRIEGDTYPGMRSSANR